MPQRFVLFTLVLLVSFLADIGLAQQPQLLGSIPSDTINSLFGTEIIPLGDQDGDGYDDILIWDYRSVAQLYYGGQSVNPTAALRFERFGRIRGIPGDVDGDGYLDLLVQSRPGEPDRIKLFLGGPTIDTTIDFLFGVDSLPGFHSFGLVAPDVNLNGTQELMTQENNPIAKSIVFYELGSPFDSAPDLIFGPPTWLQPFFSIGERVAIGDLNGDGQTDCVFNWRPSQDTSSGAALIYLGGGIFDTIPDVAIRRPQGFSGIRENFANEVLSCPGDLNGDGWDDLIIGSSLAFDDTLTFIYFGGPNLDTLPDITIVEPIDLVSGAGDINNDGYMDFIAGRPHDFGGFVSVYYGGPGLDSLNDFRIWDSDIPGFTTYVGMDVAGIGDYDGDGIDDFAFSAVDNQTGTVYIYAGFQDPTDVPYDYEPTLPSNFELAQNYPNPFNPSTTIEFSLSVASPTTLEIVNIVGQTVRTLINKKLNAGSYSLVWDGKDSIGRQVASGVYFCNLRAGGEFDSMKMALVR